MISIVVPTYREAGNIPLLAKSIADTLDAADLEFEIVIVDDDSRDGTEQVCKELASYLSVRLVVRRGERGLATAVIRGIEEASGELIVVMDADLTHPPDAIPAMVAALRSGEADFVIGSRYVPGATIHQGWTIFRQINSKIPCWLSRPLTTVRDPMSGFFAFERARLPECLSPIGYKIGLEILVKGQFQKPKEVPIHFAERHEGESKLNTKEQLNFVRHLGRLYAHAGTRAVLSRLSAHKV